jgi:AcrR family transcriptional regulator
VNGTLFEDPDDTREEILAATYRALCEHGYSELTVQRIGDEFERSTSLLYYHYEDKDDLVLATLEFLLESLEAKFTTGEITDPRDQLEAFFEELLGASMEETHLEALLELRARATREERYREHFQRSDRFFETYLSELIEAGIETGEFRDVDPDAVATTLITFLNGIVLHRSVGSSGEWIEGTKTELLTYLEHRLYRDA